MSSGLFIAGRISLLPEWFACPDKFQRENEREDCAAWKRNPLFHGNFVGKQSPDSPICQYRGWVDMSIAIKPVHLCQGISGQRVYPFYLLAHLSVANTATDVTDGDRSVP